MASKCTVCGKVFNSVSGFDKHRTGEFADKSRRCLSDEEMAAKDFRLNANGKWVVGEMPAFYKEADDGK
jgi:hypothetical protein